MYIFYLISVIPVKPTLEVIPNDGNVAQFSEVSFKCVTDSSKTGEPGTYEIFRSGNANPVATGNIGDSYTINRINFADQGIYTCKVTYSGVESALSESHSVNVVGKTSYLTLQEI